MKINHRMGSENGSPVTKKKLIIIQGHLGVATERMSSPIENADRTRYRVLKYKPSGNSDSLKEN